VTTVSPQLILASTSPYRRRLLERLALPFTCEAPKVEESPRPGEAAHALARRLARDKACEVSRRTPDALVLGSDQTAMVGARPLSKPGSLERAQQQLRACRGATACFYTAVALCSAGVVHDEQCVETQVRFRALSDEEIDAYLERDQPFDCAGSFRWEGIGICLFQSLSSEDPTALEGFGLIGVADMLRRAGLNPLLNPD